MKTKLILLCFFNLSLVVLATENQNPNNYVAGSFLLRVGAEANCGYSTLQDALNAAKFNANGTATDYIYVSTNHTDTSINASIDGQSIIIIGGFDNCSDNTSSGRSILDGSGGSANSVLQISGGNSGTSFNVILQNLIIKGGEDDGYGGGIDISGGMDVSLKNTIVDGNVSTKGGGVSLRGSQGASLVVGESSQIINNTATEEGGGIFCDSGYVELNTSVIGFNIATIFGGGASVSNGCLFRSTSGGILQGIIFNSANSGGGIAVTSAIVELIGSVTSPASVSNNTAVASGGGIATRGYDGIIRATNATINNNSANTGGGVSLSGFGGAQFVMQQISGQVCSYSTKCSTISGNIANYTGGFYQDNGNAEIYQTYIENNSSSVSYFYGSAINVRTGGDLLIEGVVIANNQGAESVISVISQLSKLTLSFVTIVDNQASVALINTMNSIFGDGQELNIYSSIIWGSDGTPILKRDNSTAMEVDCIIAYGTASLPTGAYISSNNPLFVDSANGDFHLGSQSPAIDYCDNNAYLATHFDVEQQTRGVDNPNIADNFLVSWFDVGADEWMPVDLIFLNGFE